MATTRAPTAASTTPAPTLAAATTTTTPNVTTTSVNREPDNAWCLCYADMTTFDNDVQAYQVCDMWNYLGLISGAGCRAYEMMGMFFLNQITPQATQVCEEVKKVDAMLCEQMHKIGANFIKAGLIGYQAEKAETA